MILFDLYVILQGKEALEELINDKLSRHEISDEHREELLKLLVDHFENVDDPKQLQLRKGGRFSKKSSKKSSPSSTKSESKDSPPLSQATEVENMETSSKTETTINKDIITPIQNNANPVEVN